MNKNCHVNVIGGGFAGIECALFLAEHGIRVHLFNCQSNKNKCDHISGHCINFLKDDGTVRKHLQKEIKVLGSQLIDEYLRLEQDDKSSCSENVIDYGIKKIKNHPNIDYFDLCLHEINLKEINIIASGHRTEGRLYQWLENEFGSLKCFSTYPVFPIVCNVDETLIKKGLDEDVFFIPLDYNQYISFCNKVIEERNRYIDYLKKRGRELECIEEIVLKNKDAIKNSIFKPVFIQDVERPYAAIKLLHFKGKYQIQGFCSNLPIEAQDRIIKSIKGLINITLIRESEPLHNSYLNAPLLLNEYWQSKKHENLFFAGNIAGVFGKIEGMASGLIVAHYVLSYIKGRKMPNLPKNTCMGLIGENLFAQSPINFRPIGANCDIIRKIDKDFIINNSISLLKNFEEEYHVRNV